MIRGMPEKKNSKIEKEYVPDNSPVASAIRQLAFAYASRDGLLYDVVYLSNRRMFKDIFKDNEIKYKEFLFKIGKSLDRIPIEIELPDGRYVLIRDFDYPYFARKKDWLDYWGLFHESDILEMNKAKKMAAEFEIEDKEEFGEFTSQITFTHDNFYRFMEKQIPGILNRILKSLKRS